MFIVNPEVAAKLEEAGWTEGREFVVSPHVPQIEDIRRLSVRPGDRLVIRIPRAIDDSEYAALREGMEAALPPVEDVKIIVLDQGMTLDVLSPGVTE